MGRSVSRLTCIVTMITSRPMTDLETLRYPVGRAPKSRDPLTPAARAGHLVIWDETPGRVRALVEGLSDAQLDTPYRPGGWTIRQVVHHMPDSHLNAYVRVKLAATEDAPAIKTYDEVKWAELPDAKNGAV